MAELEPIVTKGSTSIVAVLLMSRWVITIRSWRRERRRHAFVPRFFTPVSQPHRSKEWHRERLSAEFESAGRYKAEKTQEENCYEESKRVTLLDQSR
jgi:hypothetical protein